jgi:hypothetical protein
MEIDNGNDETQPSAQALSALAGPVLIVTDIDEDIKMGGCSSSPSAVNQNIAQDQQAVAAYNCAATTQPEVLDSTPLTDNNFVLYQEPTALQPPVLQPQGDIPKPQATMAMQRPLPSFKPSAFNLSEPVAPSTSERLSAAPTLLSVQPTIPTQPATPKQPIALPASQTSVVPPGQQQSGTDVPQAISDSKNGTINENASAVQSSVPLSVAGPSYSLSKQSFAEEKINGFSTTVEPRPKIAAQPPEVTVNSATGDSTAAEDALPQRPESVSDSEQQFDNVPIAKDVEADESELGGASIGDTDSELSNMSEVRFECLAKEFERTKDHEDNQDDGLSSRKYEGNSRISKPSNQSVL